MVETIVKNPKTNEEYNCNEIVSKLYGIYQKEHGAGVQFNHYIKILESAIEWNDNIEKDIQKLTELIESSGLSSDFERQLNKVKIRSITEDEGYIPITQKYESLYNMRTNEKGISFLNETLDKQTNGISAGTICTIAGTTGSMKTTYAINIAYNALKEGKNVCYISLEESPERLFSKMMSRVSLDIDPSKAIEVSDILNNKLDEKSKEYLFKEVLTYFSNLNGQFALIGENELTSYDFKDIERKLRVIDNYMKENENRKGIELLVIDHIQLLKFANAEKDEKSIMNAYVSFFRKQSLSFLGEDREIAIILLSQVNREGMKYSHNSKNDGGYLLNQIAEASEIERASTYIITTYSDSMAQITKQLKVGALKLRNAQLPVGTIAVPTDGKYYQVGEITIPDIMKYSENDISITDNKSCELMDLDEFCMN